MIKVYRKKQTTTVHLTQDVLNKYNDLCITGNFVVFGTNHYTDIKPMVITDYAKISKRMVTFLFSGISVTTVQPLPT